MIEKERGKDPGLVVIDEFVGQWLALFCLPRAIAIYIIGFALFRLFDIWKPFPVNRIQSLPGGWGIMLDDVLAAIYTNLCLHLFVFIVKV